MTTKKIYGPWAEWHGGECPVPPDTLVEAKFRNGLTDIGGCLAGNYGWKHADRRGDIVEYRTFTKQADLDAAENLLLNYGYTVTPPAKPLTFEDVTPMTEAPGKDTPYWAISLSHPDGVIGRYWTGSPSAGLLLKRRMAYLDKEHALVAARHIFGLKGGEL